MSDSFDRVVAAPAARYTIERELGAGGMATAYLAEDLRHQRKVAVKVLRPELVAVLGGDRFLQEIRTTANLQHPHILPLRPPGPPRLRAASFERRETAPRDGNHAARPLVHSSKPAARSS